MLRVTKLRVPAATVVDDAPLGSSQQIKDQAPQSPHGTQWSNWNGTVRCVPARIVRPTSVEQLCETVAHARQVRMAGGGHSFNAGPHTDDTLVDMRGLNRILHVQPLPGTSDVHVTVEAGITLSALAQQLAARGLSLPFYPTSGEVTLGGAVANGVHYSSLSSPALLSDEVVSMEIVSASGRRHLLKTANDLRVARVSFGTLGATYAVTLRCVPNFVVTKREETVDDSVAFAGLEGFMRSNKHARMAWFASTGRMQLRAINPSHQPADRADPGHGPKHQVRNLGARVALWLAVKVPILAPVLVRAFLPGNREVTDQAHRVFQENLDVPSVRDLSMAVPFELAEQAMRKAHEVFQRFGVEPLIPISLRALPSSDKALFAPGGGRESAIIEVLTPLADPKGETIMRAVERELRVLGGRPHWGKDFAGSVRDLYPESAWSELNRLRTRFDPRGKFVNAWVRETASAATRSR